MWISSNIVSLCVILVRIVLSLSYSICSRTTIYMCMYVCIYIHVLVYVNTKLYYINSNSMIVSNEQHTLTLIWLLILSQLLPKHWTSDF